MDEQAELTVIRRKAGVGRVPSESCGMSPAKAFRLALSKAAEEELQLAANVLTVKEERLAQAPLLESLGEEVLLVLLEGQGETKGVATFDPQLLGAVIESQTIGRVTHAPAKVRVPTRTDSAMCETVLDRALREFEAHLAAEPAAKWATGFRFGSQVENARLLGLLLEDIPYRVFRISLDLADGAKQGELVIALPMGGQGSAKPGCGAGGADAWSKALDKAVNASHAEITAVLHRLHMPLAKALSLAAGDVIELPQSALAKVSLEGADGHMAGVARLGQRRGFRALRLNGPAAVPELMMSGVGEMPATLPDVEPIPDMAITAPMPDIEGGDQPDALADMAMAPMEDAMPGDLPMAAMPMNPMMGDAADDPLEIPMAAMPMDLEID